MFFNNSFILASKSESRIKILKNNNLDFLQKKPLCNEHSIKKKLIKRGVKPNKISYFLAKEKALSVAKKNPSLLVVGSDTVIEFRGRLINKAKNLKEAKIKLKKMSGKKHFIYSSAVVYFKNKIVWKKTLKTTVAIRKMNEKDIQKYLNQTNKDFLKSVGCYQIEKLGPNIIESITGDYFNVMGFPLFSFLSFLRKFKSKK